MREFGVSIGQLQAARPGCTHPSSLYIHTCTYSSCVCARIYMHLSVAPSCEAAASDLDCHSSSSCKKLSITSSTLTNTSFHIRAQGPSLASFIYGAQVLGCHLALH